MNRQRIPPASGASERASDEYILNRRPKRGHSQAEIGILMLPLCGLSTTKKGTGIRSGTLKTVPDLIPAPLFVVLSGCCRLRAAGNAGQHRRGPARSPAVAQFRVNRLTA
jgi:hypothetical protein